MSCTDLSNVDVVTIRKDEVCGVVVWSWNVFFGQRTATGTADTWHAAMKAAKDRRASFLAVVNYKNSNERKDT